MGQVTAIFHKNYVMAFDESSEGMLEMTKSCGEHFSSEHFQNTPWLCETGVTYFEKLCQSRWKIRFHIVIKMNFNSVCVY